MALPIPLPLDIGGRSANCFNAIQLYLGESSLPDFLGPEEFVSYMASQFIQIDPEIPSAKNDVSIVWSRSAEGLKVGGIRMEDLRQELPGYPFGLVIEHAFVETKGGQVFQKRDPSFLGPYELISEELALKLYKDIKGFELTRHRKLGIAPN